MYVLGRLAVSILSILIVSYVIPGIVVDGFYTALIIAIVLGLLNIVVRPILILLTLPITIVTLGLFMLVINALLFWFIASFVEGFSISGFWAAFFGALLVSIVSSIGNKLIAKDKEEDD